MLTYVVKELEDWNHLCTLVLRNFSDKKIFLLIGELGAGKTTFVQAMGKIWGVKEHITSPTFSIMHEYHTQNHSIIYHFDLYRINSTDELKDIGIEEFLYTGHYCFIEWPEKIVEWIKEEDELKKKTVLIQIFIQIQKEKLIREVHMSEWNAQACTLFK